ncbi:MAG TPA: hypothetical protein V6C86_19570 [Oculatellaceae cyanobacterium]
MTLTRNFRSLVALCAVLAIPSAAFAVEDEFGIEHPSRTDDTNAIERAKGGDYPGAIHSIDAMQLGEVTGESLGLSASYCLKHGNYEKAIKLSKLAIEKSYDSLEVHQTYAEALEKKYDKQVEKDPALFNKCVREWLIVLRQEVGEEKGMSWHGVQLPFMEEFYKDEDRVIPARSHIMALTGVLPKWHESDEKFMKKVGKPVETDVSGEVVASDGKPVKNIQSAKTPEKKQVTVRDGRIADSKKIDANNEE